jgi:hypothetical protein
MIIKNVRISPVDRKNLNGHIYPASVFERAINSGWVYGGIWPDAGRGFTGEVKPQNVTHRIDDLRIVDGYLVGDVVILDNDDGCGDLRRAVLEAKNIFFRLAGEAMVDDNNVISDYILLSVNAIILEEDDKDLPTYESELCS